MKILMDFDGVFTDPTLEGKRCTEIFSDLLATEGQFGPEKAREVISQAREQVYAAPFSHGWRSEGRLSAFGPEDPLIEGIGIGDVLDAWANSTHTGLNQARTKLGIQSFLELCNRAFQMMNVEIQAQGGPHVDSGAVNQVKNWISSGHQVRVVSNSDPQKLRTFFDRQGIHEGPNFGFRGGARKFELSRTPKKISIGKLEIFSDRPTYRNVLEEEQPNIVVGDGLSLDLATPFALSVEGKLSPTIQLLLKRRAYNPKFTLDAIHTDGRFKVLESWNLS